MVHNLLYFMKEFAMIINVLGGINMKKNTIKLLGISMSVLLLTTGCGKVPKLKNGEEAVVTLKGNDISVETLYNKIKEKYALETLLDLIDTEVLNQKYKDTKEVKNEVQDEIDNMVEQYGEGKEETLLQKTASAWGIDNMDDLRSYLTLQYKRSKAVEDYAKDSVTDKEIEDLYNEKIFGDISAKHILISPDVDSNATSTEKEDAEKEALKKAKEVISKLKNGEDWAKLATEYSSDDSNKDKGGLLGDFVHGDMVSEFEEAALKLENGKYTTEPVKTQYGYHIIFKISQKDKPKLKTVKDDIKEELGKNKLTSDKTIQITALEKLRKDYKVEIQDDNIKTQYENYLKNAKKQLESQD